MTVTYLEDGVRKRITCDYFTSEDNGSIMFHWYDGVDHKNNVLERTLLTFNSTIIENVE